MGSRSGFCRFYSCDEDFDRFHQGLKLMACPFCAMIGALILNGILPGYAEQSSQRMKRGRRILCNHRRRKAGCGKSFSMFRADVIPRIRTLADSLMEFLTHAISGQGFASAARAACLSCHYSTAQRYLRRFRACIPQLRTRLLSLIAVPDSTSNDHCLQTMQHLHAAFADAPCAVSAYQATFQQRFF
jgi:hypothetical protein